MTLEMKPACEKCGASTGRDAEAYICLYECTFCGDCSSLMHHTCPNCGNELVRRPREKKPVA
jgi:hypothetical protein